MQQVEILYGFCKNSDYWCQFHQSFWHYWVPTILAVVLAAFAGIMTYWIQQRGKNRHTLRSLWKETEIIYKDCKEWRDNNGTEKIQKLVLENENYNPVSIRYQTSQSTIDKLLHDMPGVKPDLVEAATQFHYDDSAAVGILRFIGSENWTRITPSQRISVLKQADFHVEQLRSSSMKLHLLLSRDLKERPSASVSRSNIISRV